MAIPTANIRAILQMRSDLPTVSLEHDDLGPHVHCPECGERWEATYRYFEVEPQLPIIFRCHCDGCDHIFQILKPNPEDLLLGIVHES